MDPILPTLQAKAVDKGRSQSGFPFGLNSALSSKARQERTGPILWKLGKVGGSCPLALQWDAPPTLASLLPRWAHDPCRERYSLGG